MADDPSQQDELAGTEQPFVQHLMELRDRLLKSIVAMGVVTVLLALYPGPAALYDILAAPLVAHLPKGATLIATSVISPFMVPLKIMLMSAFLLALPVILYQAWAFVSPGLYTHEKKLVLPLVISSSVLFFIGVAFCYFFVFGQVFAFIQSFAPKSITAAPDIEAYLSFVLTMFLAFGLAFEVPIVVVGVSSYGRSQLLRWVDVLLLQGNVVRWHFISASALTALVIAYIAFLWRMGLGGRLTLRLASLRSPDRTTRWQAINRLVYWVAITLLAGAALMLALPGLGFDSVAQRAKDTLVLGMVLEPAPGLDPTMASAAAIGEVVHYNVLEGLTKVTDSGAVLPLLAAAHTRR